MCCVAGVLRGEAGLVNSLVPYSKFDWRMQE